LSFRIVCLALQVRRFLDLLSARLLPWFLDLLSARLLPCQPPIDSGSSSLSRPCMTIIQLEHATPTASRHTVRLWACPTRMARVAALCLMASSAVHRFMSRSSTESDGD